MAFDGITVAAVVKELKDNLLAGRIYKIAQPEKDELLLTIKTADGGQKRLFLSAEASLPLVYLTGSNKQAPMTAPGFCMLLRKHLQNGRITDITQPGLERIIQLHIEHLDEMGDLCKKTLAIEIMGKHSNIIFLSDENKIIDSIKHISGMVSSVREVLPGRDYFIPGADQKQDPLLADEASFKALIAGKAQPIYKALYTSYTGLSPVISQEICHAAHLDADCSSAVFAESPDGADLLSGLYRSFSAVMDSVKQGCFSPVIIYETGKPVEFSAITLSSWPEENCRHFSSISEVLELYYAQKNQISRIRQKSSDLRRIVQTALERNVKKYDLQVRQLKDTEKREKYRIYGELLNTYGYGVEPGASSMEALNYYTGEMITIPLEPQLSTSENAKKYFEKYNKLKRTFEALTALTKEVQDEITHLQSVQTSLSIALQEEDLVQIKEELIESGYIRRKGKQKKISFKSVPFHYISCDGDDIYVGKNNYQNDEITFSLAAGNDWWFHAKGIPGSHVVLRCGNKTPSDAAFEEAARLAAYYSSGREQQKLEVDYLQKKNVKKPGGSKPGFVVYYTNYSMMIDTDISSIRKAD